MSSGSDNSPSPRRSTRANRGVRNLNFQHGYTTVNSQTAQPAGTTQSSLAPQQAPQMAPQQAPQMAPQQAPQMAPQQAPQMAPQQAPQSAQTAQPVQPAQSTRPATRALTRGRLSRVRDSQGNPLLVVQPTRRRPAENSPYYSNRLRDNTDVCRVCETKQANSRDNMEYARWLKWRMCLPCYTKYGVKETFDRVVKPTARWYAKVKARREELVKDVAKQKDERKNVEETKGDEDAEGEDVSNEEMDVDSSRQADGRSLIPPSFTIRTGPSTSYVPPPVQDTARGSLYTTPSSLNTAPGSSQVAFPNIPGADPIPPQDNYRPSNLDARLPSPEPIGGSPLSPSRRNVARVQPLNERPDTALREALRSQNVIEDANLSTQEIMIRRGMSAQIDTAQDLLDTAERRRRFAEHIFDDSMDVDAPLLNEEAQHEVLTAGDGVDMMDVDDYVEYQEPSDDLDFDKMFE